jgi:hypothetical protein
MRQRRITGNRHSERSEESRRNHARPEHATARTIRPATHADTTLSGTASTKYALPLPSTLAPAYRARTREPEAAVNAIDLLRQQLNQSRDFLNGTLHEVPDDRWHAPAPGALNPIAATHAHLVVGEDGFVNGLIRGRAPLFATTWARRTGLSEPPPEGPGWHRWASSVRVDRPALHAYAEAVAADTDAYVAALTPDDLDRNIDLSSFGFDERSLGWVLSAAVVGHIQSHWGEICALNGLAGGRGFPV